MKFKSLKEQYIEMMANKISVSIEDLTENEKNIIEAGYQLFSEKMEDIKILNGENRRISIELVNLKSFSEDLFRDKNDSYEDDDYDYRK
jgi:hypothetical protein